LTGAFAQYGCRTLFFPEIDEPASHDTEDKRAELRRFLCVGRHKRLGKELVFPGACLVR